MLARYTEEYTDTSFVISSLLLQYSIPLQWQCSRWRALHLLSCA